MAEIEPHFSMRVGFFRLGYPYEIRNLASFQILASYIKSLQINFFCNQHGTEINRITLGYTEIS